MLHSAERPLIAGGDGLFWSQAAPELKEFVELTWIPVYARRAGQGSVSEEHPLAIRGAFKKPFTGRADVVLTLGFRFWSGEHFGRLPTWNDKAKYIQVDPTASRIGWQVPAEIPVVGDPKLVLRQMINRIKEAKLDFSKNRTSAWIKELAEVRANFERQVAENAKKFAHQSPDSSVPPDPRPGFGARQERHGRNRQLHVVRLDSRRTSSAASPVR